MDGPNALVRAIVIVFALIACGLLITGAKSMEAAPENGRGLYVQSKDLHCFPVASLKVSFATVFPNAEQIVIEGPAAKAYLSEYNRRGRPTGFAGDTLLLNILPNGTTMLIPIAKGLGCHRMIVGPKLHKVIMNRIARQWM